MPSPNQHLGKTGEEIAEQFLQAQGYRSLAKNWHSRYGELDLIMEKDSEIVFVEVKLRSNLSFGHPEEMVSYTKMSKIKKTAEQYLDREAGREKFWRFDIIAITLKGHDLDIDHFENVIQE